MGEIHRPRRSFRTWLAAQRQPLAAALAVLASLMLLWWYAGRWYEQRLLLEQRAEAVSEIAVRGSALSSAVNRRLARLQGLHAFAQTEGIEPDFAEKFDRFAAGLFMGSSGIRYLAVAPDSTMRYIYPLAGNEAIVGYQPLSDSRPEIVADVWQAINSSLVAFSGPVELPQGGMGLIAHQAVYQNEAYWGLVNVVMEVPALISEAGLDGAGQLEYALRDNQGRLFYGPSSVFSRDPIISQIVLPDGYWELAGAPRDGWPAMIQAPLFLARISSLLTIFLLSGLVYLTVNRQRQLADAVEQRTQELSIINTQLEQRVEERTLELTMLLNISHSVASTLELETVFDQVLHKLSLVVDYTGSAILTLEGDEFAIRAYEGQFPQETALGRRYSFDNIIGRQLIEEQEPVLISDVLGDDPYSSAFRQTSGLHDSGQYTRSWMGVPLVAGERVIGLLVLHHQEPDAYKRAAAELAMAFANHAAVAIENARLHQKAQRLAVLQERQRLGRELHDSVTQALYGIALGARTALTLVDRAPLQAESKEQLREPLDYVHSLSEGGLAEMRALIFDLRPESLEREGLVAALTKQATVLQARHHIQVTTRFAKEPAAPLSTKEALYRVAQEALHNIVKHANATSITLGLAGEGGQLVLQIEDNGQGFNVNGDFSGQLGLRSMRERIEQAGGEMTITSSAYDGTQIIATVPLA